MRNLLQAFIVLALMVTLCACIPKNGNDLGGQNLTVVRTFEADDEEGVWVTYYEMSDGTWKTDTHTYKYCLELSGEVPGTDSVRAFTVLSNREDLAFDDALWATGISSDSSDYFAPEEARIVCANFNPTN